MNKWLALALVGAVLVTVALPALAKNNESQLSELEQLYEQLIDLKKKIVDVRVELGQITLEQGNLIKEHDEKHHNWMQENNYQCPGPKLHHGNMGKRLGDPGEFGQMRRRQFEPAAK